MVKAKKLSNSEIIHKIKSPLTSISGYSDLINMEISKIDKKNRITNWTKTIKNESRKIAELLDQLDF